MEDEFDSEVIRLKKLLDDSLIQAEKENMAILHSSNRIQQDTSQSVLRNKKICPHIKSPLSYKESGLFIDERETHSRIHFLNSLQTSINKRRMMNESKNKYIPCAIPLSPPIRLKKDIDESVPFSENVQDNLLIHPQLIHTCRNSLVNCPPPRSAIVNVCNKALRPEKILIEKNFPTAPVNEIKKSSAIRTGKEHNSQSENANQNASVIFKDYKSFSNNGNFIPSKKIGVPNEVKITKAKQNEDSFKESQILESKPIAEEKSKDNKNEKAGFHFQISLDSCSAKDLVSKMLNKIPEIITKFETASDNPKEIPCTEGEKKEEEETFRNIAVFDTSKIVSPRQIHAASSSTQTTDFSFKNVPEFSKFSEKQNDVVSLSTQTDENEDLPIKKHELHCMVKEIVLDTLKSMHICDNLLIQNIPLISQKVDSGIQTEEESDVPDHLIIGAGGDAGNLLKRKDYTKTRNNLFVSKDDAQVDVNISQDNQIKYVLNKSLTETPNCSFEILEGGNVPCYYKGANAVNVIPEHSSAPNEKLNMESMVEKIYEQICKEKEASNDFSNNQFNNSIYTRDVAVQFNPLHTSTKSTSTVEFKQIDSSCQYEIYSIKSNTDASVQVENCIKPSDQKFVQVTSIGTQYNQEYFLDTFTQTEPIIDSEHSTTHTSASTTPVSESMFMDDLLSEGEIALPWNLRLLCLPGGTTTVNNADSSDTSVKEKDYSLSEGEIHPYYLNLCSFNHDDIEDEDSLKDMYLTKSKADFKPGTSTSVHYDKQDLASAHSKNLQLQMSSSFLSESECNSNSSLSIGEVSPSLFRVPLMGSKHMTENYPSNKSASETVKCSGHTVEPSSSNLRSMSSYLMNNGSSENDVKNEQNTFKKISSATLQTVDEEVHAMFE